MKKCSKCGAEADEIARFCPKCGNPLDEAPQPTGETPQPTGGGGQKPAQNTKMYSVLGFIPPILLILFAVLSMLFFIAPVAVTPGMTILGEKIPAENSGNVYKFSELGELGVTGSAISLIIFAIILLVISFILLVVCVNAKTRNSYFSFGNKKITVRSFLSVLGYIFVIVQFITACAMFAQISEADGGLGLIEAGAAPILILVFSLIFGVISAVCAGACVYLAKKRPELAQSAYGANAGEWLKRNKKPVIIASVIIAVVLILSIVLPVTITTVKKNKHNGTYYYYDAAADEYDRDYYIKLNGDKFTDSDGETGKVKFDGETVTFTTEFFGIEDVAEGTIKNHVIKLGGNTYVSEKHKHKFDGDWKTVKAATCITDGQESRVCLCGKAGNGDDGEIRTIDKVGHNYDENLICSVCGDVGFKFTVEETYCVINSIVDSAKKMTTIIIPETYNNLPVTKISDNAFSSCTSLTSITIPASMTEIGGSAFRGCNNITSATIPTTAISYIPKSKLQTVVINGGTSIDNEAFRNCTSLTSVTIPESVTEIDYGAFYGCKSLTSITIPESVTEIGNIAFNGCTSLASVTIPVGVTSIGSSAFYNCTSLKKVYISDLTAWCNIVFNNYDANPLSNRADLYLDNKLVIELIIPAGVTEICDYAFRSCTSLTSVAIHDSVTEIGFDAFCNCTSLTSVTIPASVTEIDRDAFFNCTSLTRIDYNGTIDEWKAIEKGYSWNARTGDYTVYCTDGSITKYGVETRN